MRRRALIHEVSATSDGKKLPIFCNVGSTEDVKRALAEGCEGIGLFRSEFLYLESDDFPDEQRQYEEYSRAAKLLDGKPLIVRTMDIGADKQAPYFPFLRKRTPRWGCVPSGFV